MCTVPSKICQKLIPITIIVAFKEVEFMGHSKVCRRFRIEVVHIRYNQIRNRRHRIHLQM